MRTGRVPAHRGVESRALRALVRRHALALSAAHDRANRGADRGVVAEPMLALTQLANYLTLKGSFSAGWLVLGCIEAKFCM